MGAAFARFALRSFGGVASLAPTSTNVITEALKDEDTHVEYIPHIIEDEAPGIAFGPVPRAHVPPVCCCCCCCGCGLWVVGCGCGCEL